MPFCSSKSIVIGDHRPTSCTKSQNVMSQRFFLSDVHNRLLREGLGLGLRSLGQNLWGKWTVARCSGVGRRESSRKLFTVMNVAFSNNLTSYTYIHLKLYKLHTLNYLLCYQMLKLLHSPILKTIYISINFSWTKSNNQKIKCPYLNFLCDDY